MRKYDDSDIVFIGEISDYDDLSPDSLSNTDNQDSGGKGKQASRRATWRYAETRKQFAHRHGLDFYKAPQGAVFGSLGGAMCCRPKNVDSPLFLAAQTQRSEAERHATATRNSTPSKQWFLARNEERCRNSLRVACAYDIRVDNRDLQPKEVKPNGEVVMALNDNAIIRLALDGHMVPTHQVNQIVQKLLEEHLDLQKRLDVVHGRLSAASRARTDRAFRAPTTRRSRSEKQRAWRILSRCEP
jgi:hypothetical protein